MCDSRWHSSFVFPVGLNFGHRGQWKSVQQVVQRLTSGFESSLKID